MKSQTKFFVALVTVGWAFCAAPQRCVAVDFGQAQIYPVGASPSAVVVGDFNGDGKPDIAVLNSGSRNVTILLGDGHGGFQPARNFDVGGDNPTSIVVADFNRDGKLDLAIAIPGDIPAPSTTFPTCTQSSVNLMLGNGDGTFQNPSRAVTVDSAKLFLTAGELNGDGKTDLIVLRSQNDPACPPGGGNIFLGVGDGSFQQRGEGWVWSPEIATVIAADASAPVLVADFNGDGKPDLISANSILLGNGDGTFQAPNSLPLSLHCGIFCQNSFSNFVVADFDGDGKLDLAVGVEARHCIDTCDPPSLSTVVMLGKGDGTFGPPLTLEPGGLFLVTGDFNGDGKPDIAVAPTVSLGSPLIHVLLGKGDGTFPATFDHDLGGGPIFLLAADLNGDKLPDIIAADITDAAISVLLNTSATSGADLGLTLSTIPAMVTGDLNFTATVHSGGPQDSSGVVLTENLPSGLKFVSAQPSQGTCSGTTTITCDLGAMPEPSTANVQFTVTPSAAGTFTNNLNVGGAQPDLNSGNNSVSFTVTAVVPDFTLSPTSASLTMARGGQATDTLTFTAQDGFSAAISLTCAVSGPSPMPTCGISPASVKPGNSATLTVNANSVTSKPAPLRFETTGRTLAGCLPLVACVFLFSLAIDRQRRVRWAFCLLVLAASILPAACGGGGQTKVPQTFTVTVTATSGPIQHPTNITVTEN